MSQGQFRQGGKLTAPPGTLFGSPLGTDQEDGETAGINRVIFGVRFERRKVDKESKPTRKLKHANFILVYLNISAKCHQNRSTVESRTMKDGVLVARTLLGENDGRRGPDSQSDQYALPAKRG